MHEPPDEPPASPPEGASPRPTGPGADDPLDEDASLTVEQVSDDPPAVAHVLASPCRDAVAQAAPCALHAPSRASARSSASPARTPAAPSTRRAATTRPDDSARLARSARPSAVASRGATRASSLGRGELTSLDGAGKGTSDLLAESCTERGPRLVLSGRKPDAIEQVALTSSSPVLTDDDLEVIPSPSIPVVISEAPPSAKPTPPPVPSRRSPAAALAARASRPPVTQPAAELKAPPRPTLNPVGGPRPIALISDFDEPPALDPLQALDVPLRPPRPRPRQRIHPRAVALFGGLFGLAAIGTLLALLIHHDVPGRPGAGATSASARVQAPRPPAEPPSASASARPVEPSAPPPDPGPWRATALASEDGVKMISGKLGTRSLMTALEEEHVPKPQIFRVLKAFDDPKLFDKPRKSHQYVVALDRASKRVRAFEYQASPTEVWQAREDAEGRLAGTKLDLKIEQRRVSRAVVVKDELKASLVEAGLDDDMVAMLDEVLSDRIPVERLRQGTTLRLSAQEQLVAGRFSRYLALDAVEVRLPRSEKRLRLYNFHTGKTTGVFDASGKAPFRSSWGPPLRVVRVTSRFNPKRLHPVLHTVMPHNGTDFGAPSGTPTYAVAAGTVSHVGPQGPSGNLVLIEHPNGLETGYAHLSRFAPNLKKGDKVESQQLVGYVGSTGRSTGPHLHFSVKKNGVFIDGLTVLKLNQERVVPKIDRDAFDTFRGEMDKLLDALTLPDQPAEPAGNEPDEAEPREQENHGDEDNDPATPAASGAAPAAPAPTGSDGRPEPPPAAPVTDQTTPDSAVWRPD